MRLRALVLTLPLLAACSGDGLGSLFGGGGDDDGNAKNDGGDQGTPGQFGNTDGGAGGDAACTPNLTGILRDFRANGVSGGHVDFEHYDNKGVVKGLVADDLGPDKKPVFLSSVGTSTNGAAITSKESFASWYRDVDGVNQSFEFVLPLVPVADGIASFSNDAFFPLDGRGFGNSGQDGNHVDHNFHFTFEIHLQFAYRGGEVFTFTGDDDVWAFFNNKLGIDLGGVHGSNSQTVKLDEVATKLGIVKGQVYPLDVFQAERHTVESHFRVDTTLGFVNCDKIIVLK